MNKIKIPKPNGKRNPGCLRFQFITSLWFLRVRQKMFFNTIVAQLMIHFTNWVRVNLSVQNSEPYPEGCYGASDAEHRFYAWLTLILSSDLYFKYSYT